MHKYIPFCLLSSLHQLVYKYKIFKFVELFPSVHLRTSTLSSAPFKCNLVLFELYWQPKMNPNALFTPASCCCCQLKYSVIFWHHTEPDLLFFIVLLFQFVKFVFEQFYPHLHFLSCLPWH